MELYRILIKGKEPSNSWFFAMSCFETPDEAKQHAEIYYKNHNYRVLMIPCVVF